MSEQEEGNLDTRGKTVFYTERSREPWEGLEWRSSVAGFGFHRISLWGMDFSGEA